ncbi:MAG: Fe-S cluster assembly protein SufD [Hellea sp.]|nr:Fe-S cluster assembly protein SufD [Hellea sp.]
MPVLKQLPHRRMEAWKWTDVRRAVQESDPGLLQEATPKISDLEDWDGFKKPYAGPAGDGCRLSMFHTDGTWRISVNEHTDLKKPLEITYAQPGHSSLEVNIDDGHSLILIEHYNCSEKGFSNIDIDIDLGEESELTRIIIHNDDSDHTRLQTSRIFAQNGAKLNQYMLSFGGGMSRLETRLYGEGEGIIAHMNGAYLLSGNRHADLTSFTKLDHPNCLIRQSVKGVVTDKAKGVFQGKFHVERDAQHTDAEMRHDALMLSDRAEIRSKPELEIYADDVACAHGNTIGALDDNALFYMRQRGIPMAQAKALLTEAFVASVFDDMEDDAMKASLMTQISEWLETSYGV